MRSFTPRRLLAATALLLSIATVATAAQRAFADVSGKWAVAVDMQGTTNESMLTLKQEGEALTGVIESEQIGSRNLAGNVKGDTVRFAFSVDMGGQVLDIRAAGLLKDKDNMTGQLELAGMGAAPFTAKRQP